MRARRLAAAGVLLGVGALCLILALLLPVPPLPGTRPAEELAPPGSLFLDVDGRRLYAIREGSGDPLILLLHGFGASTFSWREVISPLAHDSTVVAYDRTGFGLSDRPLPGAWKGESPYGTAYQAELAAKLIESLGKTQAVLIGNSAGGTVALQAALEHPNQVSALVLVSPAIYSTGGAPDWAKPILASAIPRRWGPLAVRSIADRGNDLIRLAWHDPSRVTPEVLAGYRLPLQVNDWDRALWEQTIAPSVANLAERLGELTLPVLILAGDDDRIVPTADSIRLSQEIPNAHLAILPGCGHVPQEECPEAFLQALETFLANLP